VGDEVVFVAGRRIHVEVGHQVAERFFRDQNLTGSWVVLSLILGLPVSFLEAVFKLYPKLSLDHLGGSLVY
jgi:hypothetical protein